MPAQHELLPALTATCEGMVAALTPKPGLRPQTEPLLLRDVLYMKRQRGDLDIQAFKYGAGDFASGLNATISGAAWAVRQWVAKSDNLGWTAEKLVNRKAFLADLEAVLAGDRVGWTAPSKRVA